MEIYSCEVNITKGKSNGVMEGYEITPLGMQKQSGSTEQTMAGAEILEGLALGWPSANTSLKPMGSSFKQEAHPALALLLDLP